MATYVVGFVFTDDWSRVVLLRKLRPAWQSGRLNGLGGKVEDGELPNAAMAREAREEAGIDTQPGEWRFYADLQTPTHRVCFFSLRSDGAYVQAQTMSDEFVATIDTAGLPQREDLVGNLHYLVPLAQWSTSDHGGTRLVLPVRLQEEAPQ